MTLALTQNTNKKQLPGRIFLLQPFDLMLHDTPQGLAALHDRFAGWVSGLEGPARFACFQVPATLNDKITSINRVALETDHDHRRKHRPQPVKRKGKKAGDRERHHGSRRHAQTEQQPGAMPAHAGSRAAPGSADIDVDFMFHREPPFGL